MTSIIAQDLINMIQFEHNNIDSLIKKTKIYYESEVMNTKHLGIKRKLRIGIS